MQQKVNKFKQNVYLEYKAKLDKSNNYACFKAI